MKKTIAWIVGLTMTAALYAHAGEWTFSLGPNYRSVEGVEFDGFDFKNPDLPQSQFVTGSIDGVPPTELSVIDYNRQVEGGDVSADLHSVTFTGDDKGSTEEAGVIIRAVNDRILADDGLTLEGSLATITVTEGGDYRVDGQTVNFTTPDPLPPPPNDGWTTNPDGSATWMGGGSAGPRSGQVNDVIGIVDYDFKINVYTLAAGVGKTFSLQPFTIRLGVGPTLTIADYDTARKQTVEFTDVNQTEAYSHTEKDDGTEVLGGAYIDCTVNYPLSERWGVGAGIRYDHVFGDVDTDFGEIELDGLSGELTLSYRF